MCCRESEIQSHLSTLVQRTRDSRFCLQFGHQRPGAADSDCSAEV